MRACLQNLQLANGALAAVLAQPLKYTVAVVPMFAGQPDHSLLQLQLTLADAALLQKSAQSQRLRRLIWLSIIVSVAAREL